MGTLKSTLINTLLPLRSTSVIDNLFAMDMVEDGESQGIREVTSVEIDLTPDRDHGDGIDASSRKLARPRHSKLVN